MSDKRTLAAIKESALIDFEERVGNLTNRLDINDVIHEIADAAVPVYDHMIAEVLASEPDLMYHNPELGAFGGYSSAILNNAAALIYEHVCEYLWEVWRNKTGDTHDS